MARKHLSERACVCVILMLQLQLQMLLLLLLSWRKLKSCAKQQVANLMFACAPGRASDHFQPGDSDGEQVRRGAHSKRPGWPDERNRQCSLSRLFVTLIIIVVVMIDIEDYERLTGAKRRASWPPEDGQDKRAATTDNKLLLLLLA